MKYLYYCFLLLIPVLSSSQYTLSGYVTDAQGDPYHEMEITIVQLEKKVITDHNGFYFFDNLESGEYAVSFDYEFDKEYRKIVIENKNAEYNVSLDRRRRFDEVTILQSRLIAQDLSSSHSLKTDELNARYTEKDVPYILESLPNAQVQSDAGNGVGYTDIRIRGIDPQHIQFSLNGIPLNDAESSRTYLVDVPDIINSTDEITVSTGFVPGRSGNGAFGASIDLFTNKLYFKSFAKIKTRFGSYNTAGFSLHANTGLIEDKFNVELRLSGQKSDGFIDRSASRLKSLSLSATKIKKDYSLRFNVFNGKEVTQQAWNGLPFQYFNIDSLMTYNSAGTERPGEPYNDETDNYNQTHVQFFYNHLIDKYNLSFTANYTNGKGFFENYKSNELLSDYNLFHPDTLSSDLIRQKWLDNDFLYAYIGIDREWNKKYSASFGIAGSKYIGNHFGQVIWSPLTLVENLNTFYYKNKGIKDELGVLAKFNYRPNNTFQMGLDIHTRSIHYVIEGSSDQPKSLNLLNKNTLISPKAFVRWFVNNKFNLDLSAAYYEREPNRQDLILNSNLKKEKLTCLDLGASLKLFHNSSTRINLYYMNYSDYLALNGELNDTGDPLRINIPSAIRAGMEFQLTVSESKLWKLFYAISVSQNKAVNYTKLIPEFVNSKIEYRKYELGDVDLAFSPSLIQSIRGSVYLMGMESSKHSFNISADYKYVSTQRLDLSDQKFSKIPSYNRINSRLQYNFNHKIVKVNSFIQLNNILNSKYVSHGWLSSYYSITEPLFDPYTAYENNIVYTKGLYPQALRHFSLGIDLTF